MTDEVKDIMFEHLKMLSDTAEDCMDEYLESITVAMVSTARFLTDLEENESDK
ncbi:MAG: hypothetical protein Q4D35_03085 [Ruminococcus sp.]|nr:hypothetical protein [Ruminococcus sp.]